MKPDKNVPLCRKCARYLNLFMVAIPRKRRSLNCCKSCGGLGLHRSYELRQLCFPFIETWEGWTLAALCSPKVWQQAKQAFHSRLSYSDQEAFAKAPSFDGEFQARLDVWDKLLSDCDAADAATAHQTLCRRWEQIRTRQR
jgi:hypothetical protein